MSRATLSRAGSVAATQLLGTSVAVALGRSAFRRPLRVLCYHGVDDEIAFDRQMEELKRSFTVVTGSQVAEARRNRTTLPNHAVWVTFDDGHSSVFERAMPVLQHHGIRATCFICPGVIDSTEPFWWDIVEHAVDVGAAPGPLPDLLRELKSEPDEQRRARVERIRLASDRINGGWQRRQATSAQIIEWQNAGHEVGNHTLDHPCLDQCSDTEAVDQVRGAHEWITELNGQPPRLFAYPNGNWSAPAEAELLRLGYDAAVLFDHRLSRPGQSAFRVSRLRIDAGADLRRFRAIVCGLHSEVLNTLTRSR